MGIRSNGLIYTKAKFSNGNVIKYCLAHRYDAHSLIGCSVYFAYLGSLCFIQPM